MAKTENLIPTNKRTKAEASEIGRKGGIASGKSRAKKATMRARLKALLSLQIGKDIKLEDVPGVQELLNDGQDIDAMDAILLTQIVSAIAGSTRAAEFVRDTIGEKPTRDNGENTTEFEDDGFVKALKASAKEVWD